MFSPRHPYTYRMLMMMPKLFYLRNADNDTQGVILEASEVGTGAISLISMSTWLRACVGRNVLMPSLPAWRSISPCPLGLVWESHFLMRFSFFQGNLVYFPLGKQKFLGKMEFPNQSLGAIFSSHQDQGFHICVRQNIETWMEEFVFVLSYRHISLIMLQFQQYAIQQYHNCVIQYVSCRYDSILEKCMIIHTKICRSFCMYSAKSQPAEFSCELIIVVH